MSANALDQGNLNEQFSILLPGDEPQVVADNGNGAAGVSQAGADDDMGAAFAAAGLKPEEPKPATSATSTLDPALIEALRKLDPTTLPPELQEHLDRHFQPAFTRKTQALAEEKRAFEQQRTDWLNRTEQILSRVGTRGEQPADRNELNDLRERIKSGDLEAIDSYVAKVVQERVAPVESTVVLRNAYESAVAAEPLLGKHAEEVGNLLRSAPEVVEMLTIQNHKFAPMVFAQLAREVEFRKLAAAHTELSQTFDARLRDAVRKGIEADRARVAGLPRQTSHAGTTASAPATSGSTPQTMEAARAKTLADLRAMGLVG